MAYGNTQNNNQKFEVSTRGISFFAHQANDPNAVIRVSLRFYGDLFTVALASPTITQDGKMTFPRENNISIAIKPDKAYILYNIIRKDICSAIEENRPLTRAIYLDRKCYNALVINVIPAEGEELPKISLMYLTGFVDGKPDKGYTIEFPKSEYYSSCTEDGCIDDSHECHTYFMMFTYALQAYCIAHGGAGAHAERVSNQYINDKITNFLYSISTRLGISNQNGGGNGYTSSTTGSGTWAPPSIPQGAAPNPPSTASSFDDLPF